MPFRYPPYQTVHRRFLQWNEQKVFDHVFLALAQDLKDKGKLDLSECGIDGSFLPAKKGEQKWAQPSEGKAPGSWQLQTALVFLSSLTSKVLHRLKLKLAPGLLCDVRRRIGVWPKRLIADKAYDSEHFRYLVRSEEGELICPHRKRPPTQDGRKLRRYKKCWKVERTFGWLIQSRRLIRDQDVLINHSESKIYLSMTKRMLARITAWVFFKTAS